MTSSGGVGGVSQVVQGQQAYTDVQKWSRLKPRGFVADVATSHQGMCKFYSWATDNLP